MMPKNFKKKKKKKYRPKTKTMTMNQETTKTFRWKQMTTMVKKKRIKENVEPEKSEDRQQVGNTSKQERTTPNTTVRKVNGKQQTVTWHVDGLKSSHVDSRVNDNFEQWCEKTPGSDDLGHVKVVRGKIHDYLGMILDFTDNGAMKVDMVYYIKGMFEEFPYPIGPAKATPWTEKLLKVNKDAPKLKEERRKAFHTFVMKCMFICKRASDQILIQESHAYPRESKKQMRVTGRN
jgi:hypothetical protein